MTLLSYRDYIEKWDEIAAIFSREAVLKGSFDSYAEGVKKKKGTTEVDDAFLAEIERWLREANTMTYKKKSKKTLVKVSNLNDDELDEALENALDLLFSPEDEENKPATRQAPTKKKKPAKSNKKK